MQGGSGKIDNLPQTDSPDAFPILFCRNHNQGFLFRQPTDSTFFAAPVGCVYLDDSSQPISPDAPSLASACATWPKPF